MNLAPGFMFRESKMLAPDGTLVEVTVCGAVSVLTHVTVLFTPITTVMLAGEKFSEWLDPSPSGIVTCGPEPVEPDEVVDVAVGV